MLPSDLLPLFLLVVFHYSYPACACTPFFPVWLDALVARPAYFSLSPSLFRNPRKREPRDYKEEPTTRSSKGAVTPLTN
ncbi:hypothetical protein LY78DRAFT_653824, partial [Colletotrichum sublineola]